MANSIRNVKLLWAQDRTADTYRLEWGEGISGSSLSSEGLFASNNKLLITGISKTGSSSQITLLTTGSHYFHENDKVSLYGFLFHTHYCTMDQFISS